ncbi:Hypothetical predicted protein [Octopus vulgaris]|uniref:Reverse transcriptase domain-containing protein n=1 Tax=Octopus vulgaris TaxID=6645 RepID=A0AA36AVQ8_OCTVU|nr:Hypothetical predicted protein [Octopus vulgaris]
MRIYPGHLQLLHAAVALHVRHSFKLKDAITIMYRPDGSIFNLGHLKFVTKTSSQHIFKLQYADDTALVSHSSAGLQRLLDHMSDAYNHAGLVINTKKTEILQQPCASDTNPCSFHVEDATIANVNQFTYLSSVLDLTDDIQRHIHLASAAFGRLSTRLLLNKNINIRTRVAVYNAVCVSILLYGYESWVPYRRHIKMLEWFLAFNNSLTYTGGTGSLMLRYRAEQTASHWR